MMTAAFASSRIEATYEAREISRAGFPGALEGLSAEGIQGLNVTLPHKEAALAGAREVSSVAREIGAANTLVRIPSGWRAENTDGPGFLMWLREIGEEKVLAHEALVLGAGGAAKAILWALLSAGCPQVTIANRTVSKARSLAKSFSARVRVAEGAAVAPARGLVVNCTSLGLEPTDALPIAREALAPSSLVLDLVYPETGLVRAAREAGASAHDGIGHLLAQGALAFELWTGKSPDRSAMRQAVLAELARRRGRGRVESPLE
jgi:shikimate dehydrogenase